MHRFIIFIEHLNHCLLYAPHSIITCSSKCTSSHSHMKRNNWKKCVNSKKRFRTRLPESDENANANAIKCITQKNANFESEILFLFLYHPRRAVERCTHFYTLSKQMIGNSCHGSDHRSDHFSVSSKFSHRSKVKKKTFSKIVIVYSSVKFDRDEGSKKKRID